jgi:hypothetical protein
VIELEEAQVRPGDLHQADPDELVGNVGDLGVETDNLPVDVGAVASGLAPEDEEDRLSGAAGLGARGGVVGVPPVLRRIDLAGLGAGVGRPEEDDGHAREQTIHGGTLRQV